MLESCKRFLTLNLYICFPISRNRAVLTSFGAWGRTKSWRLYEWKFDPIPSELFSERFNWKIRRIFESCRYEHCEKILNLKNRTKVLFEHQGIVGTSKIWGLGTKPVSPPYPYPDGPESGRLTLDA